MIELNLLPEELKKRKRLLELSKIPIIPLAAGSMAFLIALHLFLGGLILVTKKQLSAVKKTWEALAPEKAQLDSIKLAMKTAGNKTRAIEKLIEKRLSWARLLNELSDSLTANVWLTEAAYQEKTGKDSGRVRTLTLSGSALARGEDATRDIARFIKALKANKDFFTNFSDIELVSIKKSSLAGQDLMDFRLLGRFKKDEAGD